MIGAGCLGVANMSEMGLEQEYEKNHMEVPWHDYASDPEENVIITDAPITERASVVGRVGLMLLACGTGAWRVRSSMNLLSKSLGMSCSANIGLMTIDYTCFDGDDGFTRSLCLTTTGVNTSRLNRLERFVSAFGEEGSKLTGEEIHSTLDDIERTHGLYSPLSLGLASAIACGAFTFLLGGGLPEIFLAFFGAGVGNAVRSWLGKRRYTFFMCTAVSVAAACLTYTVLFRFACAFMGLSDIHESGYICSMLFVIPGFPLITSGIDLAKLDMRSGIERLAYAIVIVAVATLTAWGTALAFGLQPGDFPALGLDATTLLLLRLVASFFGVFGFSMMFNSPLLLAAYAGLVGAVANTLRLELVGFAVCPPAVAAFLGALVAGLLASRMRGHVGYPRIAVTVPSIVIMVPGLYFYKAVYNLGTMSLSESGSLLAAAGLIVAALPLGLICARILTDRTFRHCT